MAKAIFFNIPASGHVNPSLAMTAELVRRGEQVIYYATENYRRVIEATGAAFRPYAQIGDDYFEGQGLNGSNPPLAAVTMIATCQTILPELLAEVRSEQPDYLLYDSMCPWGALVGRILKLPTVASLALWIMSPRALMSSMGLNAVFTALVQGAPYIRRFGQLSKAIGKQYSIQPLSFNECFNAPADLVISYTSETLQAGGTGSDARIHFVGTTIYDRRDAPPFLLEQLDGKQVIYISLGTLINANAAFFRDSIAAFGDTPYTVVMSIGSRLSIDQFGALPANFIVRPYVPQIEILKRSALFITHAGMNSVHDALYLGVPMLLVPQQAEQSYTASRVTHFGAGLRVNNPTADTLRQSAGRILSDPTYRQNAEKIGKTLRDAGGASRAADLVLAMVREKQI